MNVTRDAAAEAARAVRVGILTTTNRWVQTGTRFWRRKPLGFISAVVLAALIVTAASAPLIMPRDPTAMSAADRLTAPGRAFLLGSDEFGRDMLSRLIWGSRTSLVIGFATAFVGVTGGAIVGLVSAYTGGKADMWAQRVLDLMMAIPLLIFAMVMVAALGGGTYKVIIAIGIGMIPRANRVVRSSVLSIKETTYVDAARCIGAGPLRIMFRHIMPNTVAPYLIVLTAMLSVAILTEASLSFLGLGTQEPNPSWGLMLAGSASFYARSAPWVPIFPGVILTITVLAFNFLGDAVRDMADPRLRTGGEGVRGR